MKIGLVLDDSLDRPDGVQQYVLTLGQWLSSRGHNVHYLVGATKRTDIPRVHSLSRNVQVVFNGNRLSTPFPVRRPVLQEFLAQEAFDILHIQMPYSPFLAGRIIRLAPECTTIVGTFHTLPLGTTVRFGTYILRQVLRGSLGRFDRICAVSQPAATFLKRTLGKDSVVIPNMIDLRCFHVQKKHLHLSTQKNCNMVFLGRLVKRKGCLELLKAINEIYNQRKVRNFEVLIAGDGVLRTTLENYITEHRLDHVVQLKGFVDETEKINLLQSADIAVFPSFGGESFGIVLLEAMATVRGVVVGGDNPGYRSVLGDHSEQLIRPKDTIHFADVLERYIKESGLRSQAHTWQLSEVKRFDTSYVGMQIEQFYQEALQSHRHMR